MRSRSACICLLILIFLSLVTETCAQTTVGIQPLGSYADSGVDQISLAGLGLHISIPLYQHQGRGAGMGTNAELIYDSDYTLSTQGQIVDMGWRVTSATAPPGTIQFHQDSSDFTQDCAPGLQHCTAGWTDYKYSFAFEDASGFLHPFGASRTRRCQQLPPSECTNVNMSGGNYALDGSGYYITINPVTPDPGPGVMLVNTPSGLLYTFQYGVTDANGNTGVTNAIDGNGTLTDDAGIAATIMGGGYSSFPYTQSTSRAPLQVQYRDTAGNNQAVTVNYSMHSVNYACVGTILVGLVDSVMYPDNTFYQFTYQADGHLASMRLPTGGTISYSVSSRCQTNTNEVGLPASLSRTTSDGTTSYSQIATANPQQLASPLTSITSVSKSDGSTEKVYFVYDLVFQANSSDSQIGQANLSYETAHNWYSPSGTILKASMKCYNGATGDCTSTAIVNPITEIATAATLGEATSNTVEYKNALGLDTEVDGYDFGTSSATRKTLTTYASLGNHISDHPASITVTDSSGNTISSTSYGYDEFSLSASPSGISGHGSVSGSRGNRTSQHAWLNTSSATLDSHWQYDDAGQIVAMQDPRGAQAAQPYWTAFGYDSTFDYCLTSKTPPTPSSGVSQATSSTCDLNTGLLQTTTDANGVQTSYTYDPMLRLNGTSSKTATGVLAASMTRNFSGGSLPETITTTVIATPSPSEVSITVLDGMGRTVSSKAPSGAEVDTTYNSMGYVQSISNPYFSTNDPTYGITSYLYDGLGRKVDQCQPDNSSSPSSTCSPANSYQSWIYNSNVVTFQDEGGSQWQKTENAFGNLTQILEPSSTSRSPTMETDYTYDTLGNLQNVAQHGINGDAARTRGFTYDSLSRLLTASNPEAGTICYGQWQGSSCVNGYDPDGNLSYKTDARNVTTNYVYDVLNRLTSKSYTIPANVTPAVVTTYPATYIYDAGMNGTVVPNAIGRLVSEFTGLANTPVTQRSIVGYDAMGRILQDQQIFGATTTPYTLQYNYDLAGNRLTWTNGVSNPGIGFTASYDLGGRLSTLVSTWDDQRSYPATIFAPPSSGAQYGSFGLIAASLGIPSSSNQGSFSQQRTFDNRLRLTSETDINQIGTPASPSTGSIVLSGSEGNVVSAGTSGTGYIAFVGGDGGGGSGGLCRPRMVCVGPDTGTISIAITSPSTGEVFTASVQYSGEDDPTLVGELADALNTSDPSGNNPLVNAAASTCNDPSMASYGQNCVALGITSIGSGATSNYPFTVSISNTSDYPFSVSSDTLTGGVDAGSIVYDQGSIYISVGLSHLSATWQSGSTVQDVANQLTPGLQEAGFSIVQTISGQNVTLHLIGSEVNGDAALGCSIYDAANQVPSFSLACDGMNPSPAGNSNPFPIYSYSIPTTSLTTGYAPNGNLLSVSDSVIGNWNYNYDSLNRLKTAQAGTSGYSPFGAALLGWSYDSFGNNQGETLSGSTSLSIPQVSHTYTGGSIVNGVVSNNPSNNQMDGYSYDAAGNLQFDKVSNNFWYDAEGRVAVINETTGYVYDAEGRRVAKLVLGSSGSSVSYQYLLGLSGEQVSELNGQGHWNHSNVYAGGKLLATYDPTGLHFQFTDWLGTKRVQALATGQVDETCQSLPFSDDLTCVGNDATEQHFTGKERDTESGLDYFGARYYASSMGRFTSPDWSINPISISFARLDNPQTLNRYSYVGNNPLRYFDRDGHSSDCGDGGDPSLVCIATSFWDKVKGWFQGGNGSAGAATPAPPPAPVTDPMFVVTSRILPPSPFTSLPSFYSLSASIGHVSGSYSYVPGTNNSIAGPGLGFSMAPASLMFTAGYSRRPEEFLKASSVQGCAAYFLAACYGRSVSPFGQRFFGEPAAQFGFGTPDFGGSFGYGFDYNSAIQGAYDAIPVNPMATIPAPGGGYIEDPSGGLAPNP